ncbi:MAG: AAA family ATPase [Patescibacteria group bacterium]|nr:AAA family ATPase [Patescibacteria group bacterium]
MYLKSLEISGFKSFAKKSILEFKAPITAIVGPNGSGKSNVAEAFRFVLGEQSIKSLRGKRGEDLIFNGGNTEGRNLNRAGVKVIFDNKKRSFNIDFDEISVERIVNRDSSNEYIINGSQIRLKDVLELLAGAHIGSSGHHIISQGEADRILNATIKERREMIEDALGLKLYQYKKLESIKKLDKTQENIKDVESLKREIAPHLKFLKKQVEKIDKVLEMKKSLVDFYKEYFKREEIYLQSKRKKIEDGMREPKQKLIELDNELVKVKEKLVETENIEHPTEVDKIVHFKDTESLLKHIDILAEEGEKSENVTDVKNILKKIRSFAKEFSIIVDKESEIEKLKAEKDVFRIIAIQNELKGVLNSLETQEKTLVFEEESFKRTLSEAYVLAGREAVDFQKLSFEIEEDRSSQEERRKNIEKIKIRIEDSGAGNSADVVKEYKEVEDRDVFLSKELEDLRKSAETLEGLIKELDVRLDTEFKNGIIKINIQFNHFFSLMFDGGNASLEIVKEKKKSDETEEIENGVEINVNLPRKKIKGLEMLSGGERALTSIALLFAISQVNPPPFIILDETDAALDEANSRKYADMIENLSHYSQLILITHNRETMSRAGVLYGVTMSSDGASKLLSIQFEEAVKVAK